MKASAWFFGCLAAAYIGGYMAGVAVYGDWLWIERMDEMTLLVYGCCLTGIGTIAGVWVGEELAE